MRKELINDNSSPNNLFPLSYPWAWESYLTMIDNNWTPREIPVAPDVAQWKNLGLTDPERFMFKAVMAQLTTFDLQRGRDISESLMIHICPAEIKHALIKQAEQEALHTWSYQYCIENFGFDEEEIYSMYKTVPEMNRRVRKAELWSLAIENLPKEIGPESVAYLIKGIFFWYMCFEGVWFCTSLAGPIQSLARRGLMKATAEQFQYILRDESSHVAFGLNLLKEFFLKYPHLKNELKEDLRNIMIDSIALEIEYAHYICPMRIFGYNANDHSQLAKYYADIRMAALGFNPIYNEACPFLWLDELLITNKEKNFFETRVTEYRSGGALQWDD